MHVMSDRCREGEGPYAMGSRGLGGSREHTVSIDTGLMDLQGPTCPPSLEET